MRLATIGLTVWWVLLWAPAAPGQESGDVFSSRGTPQSQGQFIVVSITAFGPETFDVKLKNPRTGYVHSITVTGDIFQQFKIGDSVDQVRDGKTTSLQPRAPAGQPSRAEPPPINNDPGKGPLTGYVTNDPDDEPDTAGAARQQLEALDRAIDQVPGLPDALRFGARLTGEQRKDLEKIFDLTKPHAGLKYVLAAVLSEPAAISTFVKAGQEGAAAYLAAQGAKNALAEAGTTAAADFEKAATESLDAQKLPAEGPYSQWPPVKGSPEGTLQKDLAADQEKFVQRALTPGRYEQSPARAANRAMMRMLYRLAAAENQGKDAATLPEHAFQAQGITGAEAAFDKRVILDNLTSLKKWGVLENNANLLKMRGGGAPFSPVLEERIDVIHTLPVKGAESLANKLYNLRLGPTGPNIKASNALNQTRLNYAKALHDAGLMTDQAFEALPAILSN
jgi:hypothetical protein